MTKCYADGKIRDLTKEEQADYDAMQVEANSVPVKLEEVRIIRDRLLTSSDWRASSDYTMSDNWKAKRQSWRDAPANFNTSEKLDELLARDSDGKLTHTIWSKP